MKRFISSVFDKSVKLVPRIINLLSKHNSFRIIYYHRINYQLDDYYFDTGIDIRTFKRQISELKKKYRFITLTEALEKAQKQESLTDFISLTFDDGFREIFDYIHPILNSEGITGTIYLIERCIDNNDLMWRNKVLYLQKNLPKKEILALQLALNEHFSRQYEPNSSLLSSSYEWDMSSKDEYANFLWDNSIDISIESFLNEHKPYLSGEQIIELLNSGYEIGCHTYSHPRCNKLTPKELKEEVIDSASRLEKRFGVDINSLSYPFGERPSRELEIEILKNSKIITLQGINDRLNNFSDPRFWERCNMEHDYKNSLSSFNLFPHLKKYSF